MGNTEHVTLPHDQSESFYHLFMIWFEAADMDDFVVAAS
jgi:hypothetical protein